MVTTTTSQACPEFLPAFLSSVSWFITELAVFRQLPTFHIDSFISRSISSSNWPLIVVVKVVSVATKCWNSVRCSLLDKDRLRVVLAPHALYFGHGSVDTRDLPRTPSGLCWDSVSTLVQAVSTLVTFPELLLGCIGTVCRHYLK
ncbi:hypothetical protein Taro_004076 [Colocasia esculenta]|uniref:Uncharacterized protein n=1 Tax=Colocasia esculenta TaxID=4460 RepID=A0A843TL50_COLES|nr:hypothetical protein [Colocasia esculenta]